MNRTHRLRAGAHRLMWTQRHMQEPLRQAEERAAAAAMAGRPIPAAVKHVRYRYEYPAGQNVYEVYPHNLSEFDVYTAAVGSPRDLTLAAMADASQTEVLP